ncbi:MAG: rod shape-determining protein MreD [Nitrospinota bacterium]
MIVFYDIGLIIAILILQTTLAEFVAEVAGAKPDLILLLVVSLGLLRGKTAGMGYGWALGLLQDGLSGSLLGQNALSKGLIGFTAGVLHRNLGDLTPIIQILVVPIATLFDAAIYLGTASLLYDAPVSQKALGTLGIVVLLNTAGSPAVSWMVRACLRRLKRISGEAPLARPR